MIEDNNDAAIWLLRASVIALLVILAFVSMVFAKAEEEYYSDKGAIGASATVQENPCNKCIEFCR